MHNLRFSFLVPYSADKMFMLVNDISAYPNFIPECTFIRIIEKKDNELIAEMKVTKAGISQSITTRNVMIQNRSITMYLITGPFRCFIGNWYFIPLSELESKIELYLDFEFKSKLIETAFGPSIKKIANSMFMSFILRAKEVNNVSRYSSRSSICITRISVSNSSGHKRREYY